MGALSGKTTESRLSLCSPRVLGVLVLCCVFLRVGPVCRSRLLVRPPIYSDIMIPVCVGPVLRRFQAFVLLSSSVLSGGRSRPRLSLTCFRGFLLVCRVEKDHGKSTAVCEILGKIDT